MKWHISLVGTACIEFLCPLDTIRNYRVQAVFQRSVHLTDEHSVYCLVAPELGAGPCQMIVSTHDTELLLPLQHIQVDQQLYWDYTRKRLVTDTLELDMTEVKVWETDIFSQLYTTQAIRAYPIIRSMKTTLIPDIAFVLMGQQLCSAIRNKDVPLFTQTVMRLLGRGIGLTPTGDDILFGFYSGLLWIGHLPGGSQVHRWQHILGEIIIHHAQENTTRLSAALLIQLIIHQQCSETWATLWEAMLGDRCPSFVESSLNQWLKTGHSSGSDTIFGLKLVMQIADSFNLMHV